MRKSRALRQRVSNELSESDGDQKMSDTPVAASRAKVLPGPVGASSVPVGDAKQPVDFRGADPPIIVG
jgi:hypothetical protein